VGELAALGAALAWAVGSLLFARIGRSTSAFAMSVGKSVSAGLLLVGATFLLGGLSTSVPARAYVWLAASSVAGIAIGDTAYFGAIVRLGVPRAIVLLSTAPLFATIFGTVFLSEELGLRGAAGIALTLAGVMLVVWRREPSTAPPRGLALGIALGVLSGVGQATGSVLSKHAMSFGILPGLAGGLRLLFGGMMLAIAFALTGRARAVLTELGTDRKWVAIAGASLVGSFVGIWLAQIAIQRTASVGVASTLLATSPVFALPLAHFAGQERLRPMSAAGAVIAVVGVALLTAR
jgi:drug/metabolite transporter (DMT)-like permease